MHVADLLANVSSGSNHQVGHLPHFALPAARQQCDHIRIRWYLELFTHAVSIRMLWQFVRQRMTNVGYGYSGTLIDGHFIWKKRKHLVRCALDLVYALASPGPDRSRNKRRFNSALNRNNLGKLRTTST